MKLLIISNRLPVTVGKTIRKSSGGLVTAMENLDFDFDLTWIGWAGNYVRSREEQQELTERLQSDFNYAPVFLTRRDIVSYYQGFSNASLWPVLHYMPNLMQYEKSWWDSYQRINQLFCDEALKHIEDDTVVWVHDYHLMLLPALLKEKKPDLKVGFFLHTPFPSYEVFRCHPNREQLVQGLLGSDLAGFHTFGYVRHFKSAVLRILGFEADMNAIHHSKGKTHTNVFPIGINSQKFIDELSSPDFRKTKKKFAEVYRGKKIVLSVERLDYTKGIRQRLDAIDSFLQGYKDKNSIVFIFISVPSRGEVREYQLFIEEIESLVGKINGTHATVENIPVHFIHRSVNFHELCALYNLADVALVTPLFDGMNLVAKEYLACQEQGNGMLVLSEFAGAADELFSAEIINPYNISQLVATLYDVFDMDPDVKRKRMEHMREHVIKYDSNHWAAAFLKELAAIEQKDIQVIAVSEEMDAIVSPFKGIDNAAFFIDYDGTLREFEDVPGAASPTEEIREILDALTASKKIDLYIISGRKREDLEKWFPAFSGTLVAEHGLVYKSPSSSQWEHIGEPREDTWKKDILSIFHRFEGVTPGSLTEEKSSSVVWHYRRCDPEFGKIKANMLLEELYEIPSNLPLEVHQGHKIIEVSSMYVNKGAAVNYFTGKAAHDIVFCAGDDYTDESMFQADLQRQVNVKVGDGMTRAEYRVKDPKTFHRLLRNIANVLK